MKNWLESTSVRDIQVFITFVNFYQHFILGFSRIAALSTLILKITGLFIESFPRVFKASHNEVVENSNSKANKIVVDLSKSKNKKSKKLTHMPNIIAMWKSNFLTLNAKKTFNHLWLTFIKAPIFWHIDLKNHIQIKIDVLGYAIGKVFS